jgi:hypothetical protein
MAARMTSESVLRAYKLVGMDIEDFKPSLFRSLDPDPTTRAIMRTSTATLSFLAAARIASAFPFMAGAGFGTLLRSPSVVRHGLFVVL